MKIAISATRSSLAAPMEEWFERCSCFVIADLGGAIHDSVHHPGRKRRPGPGVQVSSLLVERGASVVLTGRCEPKTLDHLASAGLSVVTGCQGTVQQVLERFAADFNGQIVDDPELSRGARKNTDGLVQEPRTVVGGGRHRRRDRRSAGSYGTGDYRGV
jgi:predicted Fe-Mo cluster-binding NifX family protein